MTREEEARFRWAEYVRVHTAAAVRRGEIARPATCERCGESPGGRHGKIHAHHVHYGRPLDVAWICPACHIAEHARIERDGADPFAGLDIPRNVAFARRPKCTRCWEPGHRRHRCTNALQPMPVAWLDEAAAAE